MHEKFNYGKPFISSVISKHFKIFKPVQYWLQTLDTQVPSYVIDRRSLKHRRFQKKQALNTEDIAMVKKVLDI